MGLATSIAHVPLSDALPSDYVAAAGDLRRLARELEVHRLAADRIEWTWHPEHVEPSPEIPEGVYQILLDGTITFDGGGDALDLAVGVAWNPGLTVYASVHVDCWCPQHHGGHHVRWAEWQVTSRQDLVDGFAAGRAMVMNMLDTGPYEPRAWRVEAGLPDAPSEEK
jgi:hypothetical protein